MGQFGEEWNHLEKNEIIYAQVISHILSNLILKTILVQMKKTRLRVVEQFAQYHASRF